jgi:hypothetical protein
MPQKAKAAVKHDHDHDVQHTLDSDTHADKSSEPPQPKHAPRAACAAADKMTPIAKAAEHTITLPHLCNM